MSDDNLTREQAKARSSLVEVSSYEVHLDHTLGDDHFGSTTTIRFGCKEPGAHTFLDFAAPDVTAITLNGREVPLTACHDKRIDLYGLADENEVSVSAACKYSKTGFGMHRFSDPADGLVYTYTDFEPYQAHRVFPCFDQPDLKATFEFSVVAQTGWKVISNTPVVSQPTAGEAGIWRFKATPRLSTYLACVVAGPFEGFTSEHSGVEFGVYARRSMAQYLEHEEMFLISHQVFDFFQAQFDFPYYLPKYDHVFVPEFLPGAMENPGLITVNELMLFRSRVTDARREQRAEYIAHEMAHMWFGDLVTMKWWEDLWLNESFATLMAYIAIGAATRFTNSWVAFNRTWKAAALSQDQKPTTHPIAADIPDIESTHVNFDGITYAKGASVLRQLFAWVGEEGFFEGIRRYFKRYAFSNADLHAFLEALEESSGRDLQLWSKEWIETAGVNTLRPSFTELDGCYQSFSLSQEAPADWPTLRSHRLAIGLYDDEGETIRLRRRVEVDISGAETAISDLVGEPVPDLLVINDGDLTYAKTRFDGRSLENLVGGLGRIDDPLTRMVCWATAWDMVRDAELATSAFLDMVLGNIGTETDIGVAQLLLTNVQTAIHRYSHPKLSRQALARLASEAHTAMLSAEPGGDLQLEWAQTFIGTGSESQRLNRPFIGAASGPEQLDRLPKLLDGGFEVPGLPMDLALRWSAVLTLVSRGAAGEDLIELQLREDPTAQGERLADTSRAAVPTAAAKRRAWQLIQDPEAPHYQSKAAMAGFFLPQQEEITASYVEAYFEALPAVWASRTQEVAIDFAKGLFPATHIDHATIDRCETFLHSNELAFPIRRLVIEGQDELERALKAREADAPK